MINQKGQSLVEALIALGVASIVVSAMAVAAITAVNNSDFSKLQSLATNYAQQGIEIVRQQSQTNWTTFDDLAGAWDNPSSYCLAQKTPPSFDKPGVLCDLSAPNIEDQNGKLFFVRVVSLRHIKFNILYTTPSIVHPGCSVSGSIDAITTVSWTDGKCSGGSLCHDVTLESCFVDINSF